MKYTTLFAVIAAATLAACQGQAPAQSPVATDAGVSSASNAQRTGFDMPQTVAAVDEAKVVEVDTAALTKATWTGKACDLKVPEGTSEMTVSKGGTNQLEGYVVDPADAPAGKFDFILKADKSFAIPASTGASRPDVAEFFKIPALATAGFKFTTTLANVPAGRYMVNFVMDRNGTQYFCESGKAIVVQ